MATMNMIQALNSALDVMLTKDPNVLTFGEDVILRSFERAPPDYILLVHRDTAEYGVPYFGSDPRNGQAIMDWIRTRYTTIEVIGQTPLHEGGYGIAILKGITTP